MLNYSSGVCIVRGEEDKWGEGEFNLHPPKQEVHRRCIKLTRRKREADTGDDDKASVCCPGEQDG